MFWGFHKAADFGGASSACHLGRCLVMLWFSCGGEWSKTLLCWAGLALECVFLSDIQFHQGVGARGAVEKSCVGGMSRGEGEGRCHDGRSSVF